MFLNGSKSIQTTRVEGRSAVLLGLELARGADLSSGAGSGATLILQDSGTAGEVSKR